MAKMTPPATTENKQANTKTKSKIDKAKPTVPTEQTPPESIKPLQLKIPEERKNEFKAYAAMRGEPMNALFLKMFDEYKNKHA